MITSLLLINYTLDWKKIKSISRKLLKLPFFALEQNWNIWTVLMEARRVWTSHSPGWWLQQRLMEDAASCPRFISLVGEYIISIMSSATQVKDTRYVRTLSAHLAAHVAGARMQPCSVIWFFITSAGKRGREQTVDVISSTENVFFHLFISLYFPCMFLCSRQQIR